MRSIIGSRTKQCYPKFLAKRLFEDTTLMTAFSHPDLNNNHNMNDEIQSHETTEGGNWPALRSNYGRQTLTHQGRTMAGKRSLITIVSIQIMLSFFHFPQECLFQFLQAEKLLACDCSDNIEFNGTMCQFGNGELAKCSPPLVFKQLKIPILLEK